MEAGHEIHGKPAGTVMTAAFELNGQPFTAPNGDQRSSSTKLRFKSFARPQEEVDTGRNSAVAM